MFLGGRQRGDGTHGVAYLSLNDDRRFVVASDLHRNLLLVCKTAQRERAWKLLPEPPATFGYREAQRMVSAELRSASSFHKWFSECQRLGIIPAPRGDKFLKAIAGTGTLLTMPKAA